jgi:hypothetical protein
MLFALLIVIAFFGFLFILVMKISAGRNWAPNCLPGAGSFWASFRNSSLSARGKNRCFVWDAWHHRYDLAVDRKLSSFYKEL